MANFNPPENYQWDNNSGLYFKQFEATDDNGQPVTVVNWFNPETGQTSQSVYTAAAQPSGQQVQPMEAVQQNEQQVQPIEAMQQNVQQVLAAGAGAKNKSKYLFGILSTIGILIASVAVLFLTGIIKFPEGDRYAAQHSFDPYAGSDGIEDLAMQPYSAQQNELEMGLNNEYETSEEQQTEVLIEDESLDNGETQYTEIPMEDYYEDYPEGENMDVNDSQDDEEKGYSDIAGKYENIDLSDMELDDIPNSKIKSVTATSELEPGSGKYAPKNLIDNNSKTAWVEGISGEGVGETVTFEFYEAVPLAGFYIANGYFKSNDHYKQNGKVRWINVMLDDGTEEMFDLFEYGLVAGTTNFSVSDYAFSNYVRFGKVHVVKKVSFVIYSAEKGTKYDDICISEIGFLTVP